MTAAAIGAAITLGIAIASFLGGIFWKVALMSKENGRLTQRLEPVESRQQEDRAKTEKNFTELFARTNTAEQNISKLDTKVDNLTSLCSKMDGKLDKLMEANLAAAR